MTVSAFVFQRTHGSLEVTEKEGHAVLSWLEMCKRARHGVFWYSKPPELVAFKR
jgi:hypothetical protein